MPSALDVFAKPTRPNASSACLTSRATWTVSLKPTSGEGSRSNRTKSGRSGLSTREYHAFISMQPMFTIQSSASSSLTTGKLTHFFLRGDSRVDTSVRNVGIHAGMCPLGELHLAHEVRLDPDHVAFAHLRHLRHLAEGRGRPFQRPELVEQLLDLLTVEARADVARICELVALVVAEHERAEARRPPARSLGEAGDDEFLLAVCLDLQPVASALALDVPRLEPLRDDPLELLLLRGLQKRLAVVERFGQPHGAIPPVEELLQPLAALDEGEVDERLAFDLEQVEDVVDERRSRLPLLHGGEARAARLVEGADLAVEHAVGCLDGLRDLLGDVRETSREVVAVPAREDRLARRDLRDRAVAVPLDLEGPARAARSVLRERREHRPLRVAATLPRYRCRLVSL